MRPISAPHPAARFRRLRSSAPLRALAQENTLSVNDLIWPVFLCDGVNTRQPIGSMPGVERLSLDLVVKAAEADIIGPAVTTDNPDTPPHEQISQHLQIGHSTPLASRMSVSTDS